MTTTRTQTLETLFLAAQALPETERRAFLQRECANVPPMVTEIEALLATADKAEDYFSGLAARIGVGALRSSISSGVETSAFSGHAATIGSVDGLADTVLGGYRLLREIGAGGMATVWLAQRADGLIDRPVALKLPHIASRRAGLEERMARERRILAALTHPNIARLYDAGVTSEGRPYLALEYVEGTPIDVYCRESTLDLPARLRLFLQVARAVAHAHEKLIIHRDLKPANMLVTREGEVRLLDFGVAKLLDDTQAEPGSLTEVSGRALTPDYASPEQILGEPLTVSTDVYSLGVVLYELCAGARPYKLERESRGALEDAILKAEPAPPSSVSTTWRKELRGDIDTIVLKAIKKIPAQRYPTVHAIADDVTRHLEKRPVLARPDSAAYRARKFVRRNRAAVAGAGVVALALVGATIVSLRYAHITAEHAQRISLERKRADSIKLFLVDMLKSADPNLATAADVSVKEIVQEKFSSVANSFSDDPETKIDLLQVFADVFEVLRMPERQKEALNMQLPLVAGTRGQQSAEFAKVLAARARAEQQLGDYGSAFETVDTALRVNTALGLPRAMADNFHQQGLLHHLKGEYDEAAPLYERALGVRRDEFGEHSLEYAETLYELGVLYDELGRLEDAEKHIRQALALRQGILGAQHTTVAETMMSLGTNLSRQQRLDEAIDVNTAALAMFEALLGPDNRYAPKVINNLAHDYRRKQDLPRAKREFERALELTRRFFPGHPDEGIVLANIGDVAYFMDDYTDALSSYQQSLPIFETHMPGHPKILQMRLRIGLCNGYLARYAEGEKYFVPAFRAIEKNEIFTPAMVRDAAEEIVAVYTACGKTAEAARYRPYLAVTQ